MTTPVPELPKIYHIVHWDRLLSIIRSRKLWCDAVMTGQKHAGTNIGINEIKRRRLTIALTSRLGLRVGDCVPFNFCPRSVMLHKISTRSHDLPYRGGQGSIIHLQADLHKVIRWADKYKRLWAFTTSNAGSKHFEDFAHAQFLDKIDWDAVEATWWPEVRGAKQAEFLLQLFFPWGLIERIGVYSHEIKNNVLSVLSRATYRPPVEVERGWYY